MMSFPSNAAAQAIETTDTQVQRDRERQEAAERERQLHAPRVNLQGEKKKEPAVLVALPLEFPCFKVSKFVIELPEQLPPGTRKLGASDQPSDNFYFVAEYLDQYTGNCIGREGFNLIVRRLTEKILAKGYTTTRLSIPEQDISTGILKLTLIPGVLHQIRFADPAVTSRLNAFPVKAGELLNLRDIEQGLEQMKRVTSQDVDMQLVPAEALGESDVVVSLKRTKPWKITGNLDDTGSKGTGKVQGGLNLGWDNLLDASDVLNVGVSSDGDRDARAKGTSGYNASYSVPYGYWTASLSGNEYQYHQRIAGLFQTFVSRGKSQGLEGKVGYLFYRDQVQKYTAQFRLGRRWSHAFIDDTEVAVQYRNNTFFELALVHKHYFGEAQLDVTGAYRGGVPWFGAQRDPAALLPDTPRFSYALETLDATLSTPFTVMETRFSYTGTLHAQNANTRLYPSEWFLIGNRWSVRGFDGENSLAAEKGFYVRNEFGIPIGKTEQSAYLALDFGKVYGPNVQNLIGNSLAGAAVGLKGNVARRMTYDVFAGWSVYKPQGFRTYQPAAGFSLTFQI